MFTKSVELAARKRAMEEFPRESVGAVINGEYVPLENISKTPELNFEVEGFSADWQALIHSHTNDRLYPSYLDMKSQISMDIPWGLLAATENSASQILWWGKGVPIAPYVGRKFIHGIYDCRSLVEDYYLQELGIELGKYPRHSQWWETTENMLSRANMEKEGWEMIEEGELKVGDGLLCNVLSSKCNHCGIYLGNGKILHHLFGRLSREDSYETWKKFIRFRLRHCAKR